ncbi:hypothetical protein OsJ_36726 [Oryza sativa Japonica Group]|nr:hypothetical protein OsJ_36726 [Oryza sativa Japonica Group]
MAMESWARSASDAAADAGASPGCFRRIKIWSSLSSSSSCSRRSAARWRRQGLLSQLAVDATLTQFAIDAALARKSTAVVGMRTVTEMDGNVMTVGDF